MESEKPFTGNVLALRCLKHATIPPTILPPSRQECGLCMREEGILVGKGILSKRSFEHQELIDAAREYSAVHGCVHVKCAVEIRLERALAAFGEPAPPAASPEGGK